MGSTRFQNFRNHKEDCSRPVKFYLKACSLEWDLYGKLTRFVNVTRIFTVPKRVTLVYSFLLLNATAAKVYLRLFCCLANDTVLLGKIS